MIREDYEMKIREITKSEAVKLATTDESHFFEQKSRQVSGKKIE